MRTYDLSNLIPFSVGVDRLQPVWDFEESAATDAVTYPHYNIEKLSENSLPRHARGFFFRPVSGGDHRNTARTTR